ncbi:MAG: hypothetical protein QOJ57_2938 [Thermoleophilaceae bacterium]|nr:hypothetical protein [Thermoleophilaceae bacterium]
MRTRSLSVLIFAVLAMSAAAAAQAAVAPIDLGPGRAQHVAVDGSGAAHVTYSENQSGQDVTHYCRIPFAAAACADPPRTFTYPAGPEFGGSSGVWPLLPGGSRVLVLDSRCCQNYSTKYVYSSTDGGASFDSGTEVGDDDHSAASAAGSVLYVPPGALGRPAESVLTFSDLATLGLSFQATGTTGPPQPSNPNSVLTQGNSMSGSLGRSGDTLVAAWAQIDDGFVYWRRWSGTGDVNDAANWSPITQLELSNINSAPRLASGPGGIYIAYNAGTANPQRTVVRKFTGSGWGPALVVSEDGTPRFDIVEDSTGTLHFVREQDGALVYRFGTSPENSSFSGPQTLVADNNANGGYTNLRLGVGTGSGWVTWEDSSPVHVRALQFKPSALPPPTRGSTVNAVPTKGTVLVKLPPGAGAAGAAKASGFVPLESLGRQIPVGSTLDTRKGTVRLFSATNSSGKTQNGDFTKGLFNISQGRKNPLTTVSMTGGGLGSCSKLPRGGAPKPAAGSAKRKRRTLFSNVRGRFRTRGRNSAATVRGTKFTVTDTCRGTLTQVRSGSVRVRDFWLRKTRTVKAGQSYLARRGNR